MMKWRQTGVRQCETICFTWHMDQWSPAHFVNGDRDQCFSVAATATATAAAMVTNRLIIERLIALSRWYAKKKRHTNTGEIENWIVCSKESMVAGDFRSTWPTEKWKESKEKRETLIRNQVRGVRKKVLAMNHTQNEGKNETRITRKSRTW